MENEGTGVANIMLKAVIAIAAILLVIGIFVGPGDPVQIEVWMPATLANI